MDAPGRRQVRFSGIIVSAVLIVTQMLILSTPNGVDTAQARYPYEYKITFCYPKPGCDYAARCGFWGNECDIFNCSSFECDPE